MGACFERPSASSKSKKSPSWTPLASKKGSAIANLPLTLLTHLFPWTKNLSWLDPPGFDPIQKKEHANVCCTLTVDSPSARQKFAEWVKTPLLWHRVTILFFLIFSYFWSANPSYFFLFFLIFSYFWSANPSYFFLFFFIFSYFFLFFFLIFYFLNNKKK